MEFQYDPAQGVSLPVNRGGQGDVNPESFTAEQREESIHQGMAQGLAQRAAQTHKSTAGDTEMFAAEEKLLTLQAQISRETNPLKLETMIAKAEALASGLVGGPVEPLKAPPEPTQQSKDEWFEDYKNSNPGVQQDLEYAGQVMGSEDLAPAFHEMIDSDDEEVRVGALRTIAHLRQSPQSFVSAKESTGVSKDAERMIASTYGETMAHAISVLGNGVASGAITSKQAIQTASKDPKLLNAVYQLASDPSNNFRLAL